MNSMTGYGRAEIKTSLGQLAIDIISLNSRFLDFQLRAPRPLQPLELKVRELVLKAVSRGKVTVSFTLEESTASQLVAGLDVKAIEAHYHQLQKIRRKLKINSNLTISDLLTLPSGADINGGTSSVGDVEAFWKSVEPSIETALKRMIAMRRREGKAMVGTMKAILKHFPSLISSIRAQSTVSVEHYRKRLSARISEILDSGSISNERLEEEVTIFAEKSDVTEEFCRLTSHVDEFSRTLNLDEPIGKRLNFILQEMNREVNTIGSKCSEFSITSTVIMLKEEIEKLREMVQNAE